MDSMRLPGVHLNIKLTWDSHIDYICKECLHILRRLRHLISRTNLHHVYMRLSCVIRSLLDYASLVFLGLKAKQEKIIRKVVKRAHAIMNYGHDDKFLCSDCGQLGMHLQPSKKLWRRQPLPSSQTLDFAKV